MKKIIVFLEKSYYTVLMVFPFALGIYFTIKELVEKRNADKYVFPLAVFTIIFLLTLFIIYRIKLDEKSSYLQNIILVVILLTIFLYKYLIITYINAQPAGDFLEEYQLAQIWNKLGTYPVGQGMDCSVSYNQIWAGTMALLFHFFGESVRTIQVYNIVVTSITGVLVYSTMKEGLKCFEKYNIPYKKIATMGLVLYGFWPGYAVYTGVLTNEHTGALFGTAALLNIVLGLSWYKASWTNTIFFSVLSGLCLGIMNLYKPIMIIYFIAWAIVGLFYCLNVKSENIREGDHNTIVFRYLIALGISFLLATSINGVGVSTCEKITQKEYGEGLTIWTRLSAGLSVDDDPSERLDLIRSFESAGLTEEQMNQEFKRVLLEKMKNDYRHYPQLFLKKIERFLGAENAMFTHGTRISPALEGEKLEIVSNVWAYNKLPLLNIMGAGYLIVFFFGIFGCVGMIRYKNSMCFLASLVFWGFFLFLLFAEPQNRYKSSIYSEIAMISGLGTYIFYVSVKKFVAYWIINFPSKIHFLINKDK